MHIVFYRFFLATFLCVRIHVALAQCPPNIDFENGDLTGWETFSGTSKVVSNSNVITLTASSPITGRHTIMNATGFQGYDYYGNFPLRSPNGSNYFFKLGDNLGDHLAEGISYRFTIPAGANEFSLVYYYAIVIEDPGHELYQQPRFVVQVTNESDETTNGCSSFSFISQGPIPGFVRSPRSTTNRTYYFKDWSANTINLNGMAGNTINIIFKTADCTFTTHFAYAYLDIDARCDGRLPGSSFCADDTAAVITAPGGYLSYRWMNASNYGTLSTQQQYRIVPPPPSGTTLALELTPYDGYGCKDTLLVPLQNNLQIRPTTGGNQSICTNDSIQLGGLPVPEAIYQWSPPDGLGNANIANPLAFPNADTKYYLRVQSAGGGCRGIDSVNITRKHVSSSLSVNGNNPYCVNFGTAPIISLQGTSPIDEIKWFQGGNLIPGASQNFYHPLSSGEYKAVVLFEGCGAAIETSPVLINISNATPAIRYPDELIAQNFPVKIHARQVSTTVEWQPPFQLDNPLTHDPLFKGMNSQLYLIKHTTAQGCITVDTLLVKTFKKIAVYVPTIFHPSGTGNNTHLRPLLLGFTKVKRFSVYNRWGKLLYQSNSDFPGWDGKVNGLLEDMQTVVWYLEAIDQDGKLHIEKGTSILAY